MLSRPPASLAASTSARAGRVAATAPRARISATRASGTIDGQPVAAEQEDVAVARRRRCGVSTSTSGLGPERARDDRALRVLLGLLRRELALAHELLDERVVVGQALELAVAQR